MSDKKSDISESSSYDTPEPITSMAELNKGSSAVTAIKRLAAKIGTDGFKVNEIGLQQEVNSLQMHFDRFVAAHDLLIASAQPTEIEPHAELWNDIEDHYNNAMARLQRLFSTAQSKGNTGNIVDAASQRLARWAAMDLKLDPLSVTKFDGTLQN